MIETRAGAQPIGAYFPDPMQACTTVGSQLLGILVEIDAVAYAPPK